MVQVAIKGGAKTSDGDFEIKRERDKKSDIEDEKRKSEHAKHLLTEKKRRKKMKIMFQELHALLPTQSPKARLINIVDDAISYIRNLQQTLQNLETKKLERLNRPSTNTNVTSLIHPQNQSFLANGSSSTSHFDRVSCPKFDPFSLTFRSEPAFQTWTSSNVTLQLTGSDALINICSSKKPGLLSAVCSVLEKCKLDIVSFHISSDQSKNMFMIHSRVNAADELVAGFAYEEIYKLAALEMMLLVDS